MAQRSRYVSLLLLSVFLFLAGGAGPVFSKDHKDAEAKIQALNDQIVAANEARDLPAALRAAEGAVQAAKEEFGEKSVQAADTMNNLANLYLHLKRSAEAEQLYKKAILIYVKKLDKESVEMAASYFNLGVAYAMQKKYTAAIDILNRALTIRLKKLGPDADATRNTEQMISELTSLAYPNAEKI